MATTYVWAATRRVGLDYHGFAPTTQERTRCERSTLSPTSIMLTLEQARDSGLTPCGLCFTVCGFGRSARSGRTPCAGPVDQAVFYLRSSGRAAGKVLVREPVCQGHAWDALAAARAAGTMAKTELRPIPVDPDQPEVRQ